MMRIVFVMFVIGCVCGGCSWINQKLGVSDNWWGEEIVEDIIEGRTGVDINLSDTPEVKKSEICHKCGFELN